MNLLRRCALAGLLLAVIASLTTSVSGQDKSVRPGINDPFKDPNVKDFLDKFERESREIYSQRNQIVIACQLKPGMAVADVGAGTGLFTRLFAPVVGNKGRVYAVDIAPKFLDHIKKTCEEQKIKNVVSVLCKPDSVELPANSVDLIFICDTYHHFEFPYKTMRSIHQALRPGGQLVLIDFHRIPGKSTDWILNHVRAGQEVFTKEVADSGFKLIGEEKFLKENYLVRFEKVEGAKDKQEVKTFTYKKTPQAELALHVHYPKGWKKEDKRPAIVFFFGGGWTNGSPKQFEPQATYFAGRGLVTVRADYRIKSKHDVTPAECVEDAKSAVRWVRQNAGMLGVDPDRIVAAGGSAGGHIAACTALSPALDAKGEDVKVSSKPNALLLFNPVLRFHGVDSLMQRIGNKEELGKAISPTLHLAKDTPPAILFYGKDDRLLEQGEEFVKRSKELGHRAELFLADGVGHGFFNRSPWLERTIYRADEFLASLGYVSGKPTIQLPSKD
jgi:acetyl esterase/lipase/protein-L-isoaspartate O-methyltransferase